MNKWGPFRQCALCKLYTDKPIPIDGVGAFHTKSPYTDPPKFVGLKMRLVCAACRGKIRRSERIREQREARELANYELEFILPSN